jgi:DNA-binding NtrC family response regulator
MKRALVVDDDSQVRSVTERWLLSEGYEVTTAQDFRNAKAEIGTQVPELLVADVRLGEFNGIQLGILAKSVRPDVQVVIMSGWDDPVLRRETDHMGGTFVHKPFRGTELLDAVRGEVLLQRSA